MGEYRFEVGQRVNAHMVGPAVVTYRYRDRGGHALYVVRHEVGGWEWMDGEANLRPAPLRRGDMVERGQADSIPAGTVVRDSQAIPRLLEKRSDGFWNMFGTSSRADLSFQKSAWPVTVVEPAPGADDE